MRIQSKHAFYEINKQSALPVGIQVKEILNEDSGFAIYRTDIKTVRKLWKKYIKDEQVEIHDSNKNIWRTDATSLYQWSKKWSKVLDLPAATKFDVTRLDEFIDLILNE